MTCFRALENPLSICHVLNSFSLKYSICHSAIFGGSLSWTPSAGTCTMWKTEMWVAILFIYLFVWFCMVGGRCLAYLWNQTFVPFSSWRETFGMVKPRAVSVWALWTQLCLLRSPRYNVRESRSLVAMWGTVPGPFLWLPPTAPSRKGKNSLLHLKLSLIIPPIL